MKVPAVLYGKVFLDKRNSTRMKIFHVPSTQNSPNSRMNWASWVIGSGTDRNFTLASSERALVFRVYVAEDGNVSKALKEDFTESGLCLCTFHVVSHLYTVLSLTPVHSLECIHLLSWYHLWPRPNWNATLSSSSSLTLSLTIPLYFTHGPESHSHYRWVPYSPEIFDEREWGLFMQHHPQDQFLSQYISRHFSFSLIFIQSPN